MNPHPHRTQLFVASCLSLMVTSMIFAIRGGIGEDMASDFGLNNEQLGLIWGPAFWGFTIGIIVCALIVDVVGMKLLHILSSLGFIVGTLAVVLAPKSGGEPVDSIFANAGTTMLYCGFMSMGISQGIVEGVINPLAATLYSDKKTSIMNILHAWWPGGMIVGGLLAYFLGNAGVSWEIQLGLVIVPSIIYLLLVLKNDYPVTERVASKVSTSEMFSQLGNPFFMLMFGLMWITAASELAPDQFFPKVMEEIAKIEGILFLVYTAGLMFVLRFFFGGFIHRFSPFAVLSICSILCAAGLFGLGSLDENSGVAMAFLMATLFGIGKTFFWPLMLGVVSERCPKGGALLLNLMGGAGMLSIGVVLPWMGGLMDKYDAGTALRVMAALPGFLIVIFAIIGFVFKARGGYKPVELSAENSAG